MLVAVCAHAVSSDPDAVLADAGIGAAFGVSDCRRLLDAHAQAVGVALRGISRRESSLARVAQALLKGLGQRVPGCRGSSAAYLRDNLLAVRAAIVANAEDAPVQIVLSRAPLHVLAMLAGLTRSTFACCGRRFTVETEEGA